MAWVYTVVLAACSAGILAGGVLLTRRLFRDELLAGEDGATEDDRSEPAR